MIWFCRSSKNKFETVRLFKHFSEEHNPAISGYRLAGIVCAAFALVFVISCATTTTRTVVQLPHVPGATYIGSKECESCHAQIYRDFATADHARLMAAGADAINAGCESCHGPASLHAQSGGEVKTPFGFSPGRPHTTSFDAQQPLGRAREVDTMCFQCHSNVRSEFSLPSHHPVPEGKLSCIDCHSPHKGASRMGGGAAILSENESCLRCHASQRGPFPFEHEAVREGCVTCHKAHGSVNDKLLTVRDSNACLKCHFQSPSGGRLMIGGSDHTLRVQQGTCWTAGCHEAIHGSRVSPSLRF
jgi:predicted CXXCH cytochrome family protein